MDLLGYLKSVKSPAEIMTEMLERIVDYIQRRQWIKDRFPENEKEVLIIVEHRPFMRPVHRRVVRAFYEDGMMRTEDSFHAWEDMPDGLIPMGWYETSDYGVGYEISDPVIGWQETPDPWE